MCIDILRCHHFRCSKIFHQNRCSVSSLIKDIINNCLLTNNLFRWFDIARSCSWFALFRHLVKHVQIHYSFERELFWKSLYGLGDQNLPDMCQLHITSCHFLSVECAQQNNMMLNNYYFIQIIIILFFFFLLHLIEIVTLSATYVAVYHSEIFRCPVLADSPAMMTT